MTTQSTGNSGQAPEGCESLLINFVTLGAILTFIGCVLVGFSLWGEERASEFQTPARIEAPGHWATQWLLPVAIVLIAVVVIAVLIKNHREWENEFDSRPRPQPSTGEEKPNVIVEPGEIPKVTYRWFIKIDGVFYPASTTGNLHPVRQDDTGTFTADRSPTTQNKSGLYSYDSTNNSQFVAWGYELRSIVEKLRKQNPGKSIGAVAVEFSPYERVVYHPTDGVVRSKKGQILRVLHGGSWDVMAALESSHKTFQQERDEGLLDPGHIDKDGSIRHDNALRRWMKRNNVSEVSDDGNENGNKPESKKQPKTPPPPEPRPLTPEEKRRKWRGF
jgi:hypothetical protein